MAFFGISSSHVKNGTVRLNPGFQVSRRSPGMNQTVALAKRRSLEATFGNTHRRVSSLPWRRIRPGGFTGLQNRVAWRNAARMVRLHPFSATLFVSFACAGHEVTGHKDSAKIEEKGVIANTPENGRVCCTKLPFDHSA